MTPLSFTSHKWNLVARCVTGQRRAANNALKIDNVIFDADVTRLNFFEVAHACHTLQLDPPRGASVGIATLDVIQII